MGGRVRRGSRRESATVRGGAAASANNNAEAVAVFAQVPRILAALLDLLPYTHPAIVTVLDGYMPAQRLKPPDGQLPNTASLLQVCG